MEIKDVFMFLLFIVVVLVIWYIDRKMYVATFYTHPSSLDPIFRQRVRKILLDSKWRNYHNFKEIDDPNRADINIMLKTPDALKDFHKEKQYYPSGKQIQFSITTQSRIKKPIVYINSQNWLQGVPESKLSLEDYRSYVIEHEFGHALSYHHQPCNKSTAPNGVCPVMYQSTRGCPDGFKCGYQVSPYDQSEKISVAYLRW